MITEEQGHKDLALVMCLNHSLAIDNKHLNNLNQHTIETLDLN